MNGLLALSIRQPWLDMVLRGAKSIEIRAYPAPVGRPVALHASRTVDLVTSYLFGYKNHWRLPKGVVSGLAEIEDCYPLDFDRWRKELDKHRQIVVPSGRAFAIVLRNIQVLNVPVPYRGQTGLFQLSGEATVQVEMQARLGFQPGPVQQGD